MLERVTAPEPDAILKLMAAFAADPRPEKIDLGVGVYRTAEGHTPIMSAVKKAERQLLEVQDTKVYVGIAGDPVFNDEIRQLVLGDAAPADRIASIATPGGTGAVRQAFDLVRTLSPTATIWISDPTWLNHPAILGAVRQPWRRYRYLDREAGALDLAGMEEDLAAMAPGDALLLHGCCHNPTGVDLTADEWLWLGRLCAEHGILPIIDLAYQGFGAGVAEDVAGLRSLIRRVPEALVCVSGSKTFGLYRERVGTLLAMADNRSARERLQARLLELNRLNYTFPPDHGARLVTMILQDSELRADWEEELGGMRARINVMRSSLANALRDETGSDRFGFLAAQRGLFSLIGATPEQADRLREDHALYVVADGRINLAGLTPSTVAPAARAIADVLR